MSSAGYGERGELMEATLNPRFVRSLHHNSLVEGVLIL